MAELVWKGKKAPTYNPAEVALSVDACYGLGDERPAKPPEGWYNRLIYADKGLVLPTLLPEFSGRVNLIYIDPPFMTGRTFKAGAQILTAGGISYQDIWNNDLDVYLQWLYETFYYLHQLLAENGSLYVHLDWRATHYARIMLDEIFQAGSRNKGAGLKNEIIWHYQSGGRATKSFARKHDTILLYTKSRHYPFHAERVGQIRGSEKRNHMRKSIGPDGHPVWTIRTAGKIYTYTENSVMSRDDVWSDISHLHQKDPERTGYATQKPAALLERLLLASSEENDLVLDCFCGSGVTPVVSEQLGRRWLACDQSEVAISVTLTRLLRQSRRNVFALQSVKGVE
ncbi:DNA methyltransferase [Dictyobacter formicarum]|uniref:Site-specific DNA-methyltransferase n=1 Tax=Dictyobacter formicarum TaxID=2778368 RepID=A0ABQ3VG79_9CHLR|nr:site-specific DNA-methyltransferase [Dictyobacter formicarum]GHO84714.1 site-specific DNA-methyltransferase [Dictyobacter formicarum]